MDLGLVLRLTAPCAVGKDRACPRTDVERFTLAPEAAGDMVVERVLDVIKDEPAGVLWRRMEIALARGVDERRSAVLELHQSYITPSGHSVVEEANGEQPLFSQADEEEAVHACLRCRKHVGH